MHVDVDALRIEIEEQHERRMAAMEQHVGVSLAHGMGDDAIAHKPAVDVEVLLIGLAARRRRQADPAGQPQTRGSVLDAQALLREFFAENFADARAQRRIVSRLAAAGVPACRCG